MAQYLSKEVLVHGRGLIASIVFADDTVSSRRQNEELRYGSHVALDY
jgi:hypothetical protein